MVTTKKERDKFIKQGSPIKDDLLKIFKPDDDIVIADIGACEGLSTIIYSEIFPNARFLLFEPIDENTRIAFDNLADYNLLKRATILQVALSYWDHTAKFYKSYGQANGVNDWNTGNKSSSLMKPFRHLRVHKWCKFMQTAVPARKIDSFDVGSIDFVHMDVQGAELKVLKGGEKSFSKTKAFWIEVSNVELYKCQPLKRDVLRWFIKRGYHVVKDTCGSKKFGDILFVRE